MQKISAEELIEFNHDLIEFSNADIVISSGQSHQSAGKNQAVQKQRSFREDLEKLNDALKLADRPDQDVANIVFEFPQLGSNYQRAALAYLLTGSTRIALDQLASSARSRAPVTNRLSSALIYPTVLLILTYIGFLITCTTAGPSILMLYDQVSETPPSGVLFLQRSRELIMVWGTLIPLAIAGFWYWWRRRGTRMNWNWIPGNQNYYQTLRNAQATRQLSDLLKHGCDRNSAIALSNPDFELTKEWLTAAFQSHGQATSKSNRIASSKVNSPDWLPPLMRWAVESESANSDQPHNALDFVSHTYEKTAGRQIRSWHSLVPSIAGLLIGGLLVLAYGFSLFNPVIQMLYDLASPLTGMGGV